MALCNFFPSLKGTSSSKIQVNKRIVLLHCLTFSWYDTFCFPTCSGKERYFVVLEAFSFCANCSCHCSQNKRSFVFCTGNTTTVLDMDSVLFLYRITATSSITTASWQSVASSVPSSLITEGSLLDQVTETALFGIVVIRSKELMIWFSLLFPPR